MDINPKGVSRMNFIRAIEEAFSNGKRMASDHNPQDFYFQAGGNKWSPSRRDTLGTTWHEWAPPHGAMTFPEAMTLAFTGKQVHHEDFASGTVWSYDGGNGLISYLPRGGGERLRSNPRALQDMWYVVGER